MSDIEGGCACGAIRFRIAGPFAAVGVCHCRTCQYATGGAPNYVGLAMKPTFAITKGEPKVHTSKAAGTQIVRLEG